MTPTLYGRWQTRLWLLVIIGGAISLGFGYGLTGYDLMTLFAILGYVIGFGFVWDILYNFLQTFRWDHDWPPAFQLFAGIVEGLFLWGLIWALPDWYKPLPGIDLRLTWTLFLTHYGTVWILTFLASQSLLRLIYPRWRFRGGQWM